MNSKRGLLVVGTAKVGPDGRSKKLLKKEVQESRQFKVLLCMLHAGESFDLRKNDSI